MYYKIVKVIGLGIYKDIYKWGFHIDYLYIYNYKF